jgi:type I restriction enzyme, R subunit
MIKEQVKNIENGLPEGWQWVKLGDVCHTTSGGTPSRREPKYYNGNITWLKSGELDKAVKADPEEKVKLDKPLLAPLHVWRAYEQLEKVTGQPKNELIALVSLVRKVSGADTTLTGFDKTVDKNFQDWIFKKQAGTLKYTEEQVQWLRMIKDYIANSFHVDKDDFELDPFNKQGGLGKMWQLFGEETDAIINELNENLVA